MEEVFRQLGSCAGTPFATLLMLTRLLILCFFLFVTRPAMACSCGGAERWLKSVESQGLPANVDIFRGKVERWISAREIDVRVIEAFAGNRETRRFIALPNETSCSFEFSEREVGTEALYVVQKGGFFSVFGAQVLGFCSRLQVNQQALDRLRKIAMRTQQDPTAEKARLEAVAAERAAQEKALRGSKGERLFEPAKEEELAPQIRTELGYVRADRATIGVQPIRVNRRAIDAPVTAFVIDGKEYRFVGYVSTTRPPPQTKTVRESGYWAVTESWDGHTASGDRANIWRHIWGMSGQINVGGRRFALNSRGEFGFLSELSPTLMAEREAEANRAREEAARRPAEQRVQGGPNLAPSRPAAPTPPLEALSNAEPCARKSGMLSGLDEADGYPQSPALRRYISDLRITIKSEMVELKC